MSFLDEDNLHTIVLADDINRLSHDFHALSRDAGWWETGEANPSHKFEVATKFALIHSEVSEALEGYRKGAWDDHLPDFKSVEVEMADVLIRVFDLSGALGLRLGDAMVAKAAYNLSRADHKPEARAAVGGKKF